MAYGKRSSYSGGSKNKAPSSRRSSASTKPWKVNSGSSSSRKHATFPRAGPSGAPKKTTLNKSVSSSRSTGCFTKSGQCIRNPEAYAATGAPVRNKYGSSVRNASSYARKIQENNIQSAAKAVKTLNPKAKAFSYVAQLPNGKRYVGSTTNPARRMSQHLTGRGAKVTQELPPTAITITPHRTVTAAKHAERQTYFQEKGKRGIDNVRGAGNTARFSKVSRR